MFQGVKIKQIEHQPTGEDISDKMAVHESENFAVYSHVDFLLKIGKYASLSTVTYEAGLHSLNDYLKILDHTQGS